MKTSMGLRMVPTLTVWAALTGTLSNPKCMKAGRESEEQHEKGGVYSASGTAPGAEMHPSPEHTVALFLVSSAMNPQAEHAQFPAFPSSLAPAASHLLL